MNTHSNPPPKRGSGPADDRPWCWQEKDVIRRIRDAWDDKTYLDQALALYLILTEKASDKQSATFEVSKRELAAKSGVSLRRVTTILSEFKSLGVFSWTTNRAHGAKELLPNTYTLMLGTGCTRLGTERFRDNCAVKKESLEESLEKSFEPRPNRTKATQQTPGGVCRERNSLKKEKGEWRRGYLEDELEAIDIFHAVCCPRGFLKVNRFAPRLQSALRDELDALKILHPQDWREKLRATFEAAADAFAAGTAYTRGRNRLSRILWEKE